MANIEADMHHENVMRLIDTVIEKRGFRSWNMDKIHLKAGQTFYHGNLEAITSSFQNIIVPSSELLVDFYKSLLEEKTFKNDNAFFGKIKSMLGFKYAF